MKVLTLLNGLGMGGAEHMAYELVKNLDHDKVESPVFCYGSRGGTPLENEMSEVTELVFGNLKGHITPIHMVKILKKISGYNPDIIHAHMGGVTFGIPWCLLHKKPIVITVHTKPDVAFSKKNQKLIRKALQRGICYIVAVSEENYKYVKDYYNITETQCGFVNNGIDIPRFYRSEHEKFTYINVARQDDNKNQSSIIRCFAKIYKSDQNTRLYLVGDGPMHSELKNLVKKLNLEEAVILPGLTDKPEDYYAISDAYIQSSHREAMPLSVLEAMAAGLPVISTDVGGLRDVVKNNGRLVRDNDEAALEDAMRWIKEMGSDCRQVLATESRTIAMEYSSEKMAEKYQAIYERLVEMGCQCME